MAKENEEIRRDEFILNEKELQFERQETAKLFDDLDTSPQAILENPLNLLLANFDSQYMNSERMGVVIFNYLQETIRKYTIEINENFYYKEMKIIQIVNELLARYNTWTTNQRGLILSTRDLVRDIKKMIDEDYVTKDAIEKFKKEIDLQLTEEDKTLPKGMVGYIGGKKVILLPEDSQFKEGEFVSYRKAR